MHKPPLNIPGPSIFTEPQYIRTASRSDGRTFAQLAIAQRTAQKAADRADRLALLAYVVVSAGSMFIAGVLTGHFIW